MKNSDKRSGRPDAMKALTDARPDELNPSRLVDPLRQRQLYAHITSDPADGHVTRRKSRYRPLGAAVVLAAVTASVVVTVGTLDTHAPDDASAARPRPPAATRAPGGAAEVHVDGRIELLSAAKKAETSAEATYWQTTTRSQYTDVAEANGRLFALRVTSTEEWSVGVRPGTGSLAVSGLNSVTEPRTAADRARWHAAGSPRKVETGTSTTSGAFKHSFVMGTGRPTVMRTNTDDKIYALGPDNVSYKELRALPSTDGALRHYLEKLYAQDDSADNDTSGRSTWMLRQAGNLVTMPVKPAVRAAAYRVMADLPGVRVVGRVTDTLGREGVGIEPPDTYQTPLGTTRQRLVFDPATGAMLSDQYLLVKPSARAGRAGLEAGTMVGCRATTRMNWGEHQITVPENARG
ncbi:CU044_5270 family protein [Streptomyces sp. NPDC047841]|uniref:CU044_5270 family protein n=1 Tax=Streptomyces sp. NPDC047841 TaxID=3154708 RepID=UPI003453AFA4